MAAAEMSKKLAWWMTLVVVVVVAWQLARLTWLIWERPSGPLFLQSVTAQQAQGPGEQARKSNYQAWHLFGRQEQVAAPVVRQVDAPETRLRLDLYGVMVGTGENDSGAIVAERGRGAEYYRINDELPGNATLTAVHPDHILLSRAGVLEKLTFDEDQDSGSQVQAVEREPAGERVDSPEEFMSIAEQRLADDPRAALASVGLAPSGEGDSPSGYVYNGNNPMLAAMSMQKGDVIRSVNGHTLGNIEQDREMLKDLYESGMLEVEIERDGAVFTVNYPLR